MGDLPRALVYRDKGPVSLEETANAVEACLAGRFEVEFVGPDEEITELSADALDGFDLYVQPGGGDDLDAAWKVIGKYGHVIREFVHGGGRYVGVCMGGFLAGSGPGFKVLPGDSKEYIKTRGAEVHDDSDAEVVLQWRGKSRRVYFQNGPAFDVDDAGVDVLATYSNGEVAAFVGAVGKGAVGVSGPHPEAPADWYTDSGFVAQDCTDLFVDLVESTMACNA